MTKNEATRRAARLVKRLHGTGWEADVWDNMGWHYAAVNGGLKLCVSPSEVGGKTRYTVLLGEHDADKALGGMSYWLVRDSFTDPNAAVRRQVTEAWRFIDKLVSNVEPLSRRVGLSSDDFVPLPLHKLKSVRRPK